MSTEDFRDIVLAKISKVNIPFQLTEEGYTDNGDYIYRSKLSIHHRYLKDYSYNIEIEYVKDNDLDYPCCCVFNFFRGAASLVYVRVNIISEDEVKAFLDYIFKCCEVYYEYDITLQEMDATRQFPASLLRDYRITNILKELNTDE